ncbi:excinuclease ABC subunit UvrA, partial [Clostridium perfringens]|nr:excinuclease ABC subunit UvrA [Clostridium perfringens]
VIRGKKGTHEKILDNIKRSGFIRARVDGSIYELAEEEVSLDKNIKHNIEAVVDRIVIKEGIEGRLSDSIETALKLAEGLVVINIIDGEDILFSEKFACSECGMSIDELAPRLFSFNSPFGKCDCCDGLGTLIELDEDLIIPNKDLSILEGAIATWGEGRLKEDSWTYAILKALSEEYDIDLGRPVKELSKRELDLILYGTDGKKMKVIYTREGVKSQYSYAYDGEINSLKRRYRETNSDVIKSEIEQYMSNNHCPKCK